MGARWGVAPTLSGLTEPWQYGLEQCKCILAALLYWRLASVHRCCQLRVSTNTDELLIILVPASARPCWGACHVPPLSWWHACRHANIVLPMLMLMQFDARRSGIVTRSLSCSMLHCSTVTSKGCKCAHVDRAVPCQPLSRVHCTGDSLSTSDQQPPLHPAHALLRRINLASLCLYLACHFALFCLHHAPHPQCKGGPPLVHCAADRGPGAGAPGACSVVDRGAECRRQEACLSKQKVSRTQTGKAESGEARQAVGQSGGCGSHRAPCHPDCSRECQRKGPGVPGLSKAAGLVPASYGTIMCHAWCLRTGMRKSAGLTALRVCNLNQSKSKAEPSRCALGVQFLCSAASGARFVSQAAEEHQHTTGLQG